MHGFKIVDIYLKFVLSKTDIRYLVCDVGEAALAHDPLLLVHLVQLLRHRLVQALLVAVLLGPRLHHGGPPPHLPHNRGEESELRVCVRHDAPLRFTLATISPLYGGVVAALHTEMNELLTTRLL